MNFTLKDILSTIFRYKNGLILFTIYFCLGLSIFLVFSKKMYESNAQVLVRFGQEQLGSSTLSSDRNVYFTRREQEIQNEISILTSNDTLLAVSRTICGPDATMRELLTVREYLKKNLTASALTDSDVLSVTFSFPDPVLAQKVLGAIINEYRLHHGAVYFNANELALIAGKLQEARADYATALEALSKFEVQSRLYDAEQIAVASETIEQQRIILTGLLGEYAYTAQKRDLIRDALNEVPQNVLFLVREVRNSTHAELQARLAELKMQKEAYLSRYNASSRTVKDIDNEVGLLTALLNEQPERLIDDKETRTNETWIQLDQVLQDLNPEVEAQKARIDILTKQIRQMETNLANAVGATSQHTLLDQDVELKKEIYDRYYQNYSDAIGREAAQQESITNVSVLEMPSLATKWSEPNLPRVLALAIASLVAGNVFILFVSVFVDNTLSSPEQAEKTFKYPVVGIFNARKTPDATNFPVNPNYDIYRKDYRQLFLKLVRNGDPASILFSSSAYGVDLSDLTTDFTMFARKYQKRNPVIINYQHEDAKKERSEFEYNPDRPAQQIEGIDEYRRSDNVDVAKEADFWKTLKSNHDLLVFNYSPLQESSLLIALADELDWAVYDIEAEKTNRYVASSSIDTLVQYGFKKIGLVMSNRRFHIPAFLYRYL